MVAYLVCYKHGEEVFRRKSELCHIIDEDSITTCDDQIFICNIGHIYPFTRTGVQQQLALEDPITEIERRKNKK